MLSIGEVSLQQKDLQTRLCADFSLDGHKATLWFAVPSAQQDFLCPQRSDAFVMALLPTAMRGGHDIVCHTPISSRLKYQLEYYLLPALTAGDDWYHPIRIDGPMTHAPVANSGGVGICFSGDVHSLYAAMTHGPGSTYPATHLAVVNTGFFEEGQVSLSFRDVCSCAEALAKELSVGCLWLDSNISEVLPEPAGEISTFRKLAGALALQGLLSTWVLPARCKVADYALELHDCCRYDLLNAHCAQTESLKVWLSDGQYTAEEKQAALDNRVPAGICR